MIATITKFTDKHALIGSICLALLWLIMLFIPWDTEFFGVEIYPLIMMRLFPIIGGLLILLSVLSRKISLFFMGIFTVFGFLLHLFFIFGIIPLFLGN
ncbi:hypothetical protein AB1I63_06210 [Streptococcus pneumoniae]